MTAEQSRLRLLDYLAHMVEAAGLASAYVEGMDRNEFEKDTKTQQAVILNILVIGEAATKICTEYPEFVVEHPEVPWKQMRGMRNRMAHGYFEIDLDIVWDTVRKSLPALKTQLLDISH